MLSLFAKIDPPPPPNAPRVPPNNYIHSGPVCSLPPFRDTHPSYDIFLIVRLFFQANLKEFAAFFRTIFKSSLGIAIDNAKGLVGVWAGGYGSTSEKVAACLELALRVCREGHWKVGNTAGLAASGGGANLRVKPKPNRGRIVYPAPRIYISTCVVKKRNHTRTK